MVDFITVTITSTRGSTPREAGTSMQIYADRTDGTIGGGALEWDAIRIGRAMLKNGDHQASHTISLGPDLGQCCGGSVTLNFSDQSVAKTPTEPPLWIWGAGHVGRAIANVIAPLEDRQITLIDTTAQRMPGVLPTGVTPLVAADPLRVVACAPKNADHLIATYSHDIDLALCDAMLRHGFASAGLIGSATKWARFRARLGAMGHLPAQISRIACPIGDPSLGKHPQAIAVSVAVALISSSAKVAINIKTKEHAG